MELIEKLADLKLIESRWQLIYQNKNKQIRRISKGIDGISIRNFKLKESFYLKEILISLECRDYQFNDIRCSTRKKSDNKYRVISEPTVRDRIVHRAIHKIINPQIYPIIDTGVSYCGVKEDIDKKDEHGLNIRKAIEELVYWVNRGYFWIFESDIKGFFDNVPKHRIFKKITTILHPDNSLNELIKQIIFYNIGNEEDLVKVGLEIKNNVKGIAQGSSLSPLFANLYLADFDNEMKRKFGKRFIRYVDDFIVLCKTEEEAIFAKKEAVRILKNEKLSLSKDKNKTRTVNLIRNGDFIKFLGLKISKNKIEPKKNVNEIIDWLKTKVLKLDNYEIKIIKNNNGKIIQRIPIINQINEILRGWGEFYKFYHVEKHFKIIDNFLSVYIQKKPSLKKILFLNEIKKNKIIPELKWKKLFIRK